MTKYLIFSTDLLLKTLKNKEKMSKIKRKYFPETTLKYFG